MEIQEIPEDEAGRSPLVIVYAAMALSGGIVGLFTGWLIWGVM